jgi:hypothetical protein
VTALKEPGFGAGGLGLEGLKLGIEEIEGR